MSHRSSTLRSVLIALFALALTSAIVVRATQGDDDAPPSAPAAAKEKSSMPSVPVYSKSGYDVTPLSRERVAELAAKLTPEQYEITQKAGTERAFCGNLLDNKKDGFYACVVCGLPLFKSEHKFNSGTGWPSFFTGFDSAHIAMIEDLSHGMVRTEIDCARCMAHLGHVFEDGPAPTGLRYCLNSASLTFVEKGSEIPEASRPVATETAYFAGGCFWGVEHWFQRGSGVISAESGYMQGEKLNPTYKDVCYTDTGHAETVRVTFDPRHITYRQLLEAFFKMHDPTQLNRQGPDEGTQYRSGIWCASDAHLAEAKKFVDELQGSSAYRGRKIVTQIEKAKTFYPAEEYHQDYIEKTGRACHVRDPWSK